MAALGAAGSFASQKLMGGNKTAAPMDLPKPPSMDDAALKAERIARYKRASQSQTTFTSPLGIGGAAQVARKTLLGQ